MCIRDSCQIVRRDQIERMKELKLRVNLQSIFLDYDTHIVRERVGDELAGTSYPAKTLLNARIPFSNGSDEMCIRDRQRTVLSPTCWATSITYRRPSTVSERASLIFGRTPDSNCTSMTGPEICTILPVFTLFTLPSCVFDAVPSHRRLSLIHIYINFAQTVCK